MPQMKLVSLSASQLGINNQSDLERTNTSKIFNPQGLFF